MRGGEAERTGPQALADKCGHCVDVVGGGVVDRPLAHDVGTQCAVGHLGAEVEDPLAGIEVVEVLGEGLPAPLDAVGQGRPGDVLDTFHQLDQEVAAIRGGRRKPTPQLPITRW